MLVYSSHPLLSSASTQLCSFSAFRLTPYFFPSPKRNLHDQTGQAASRRGPPEGLQRASRGSRGFIRLLSSRASDDSSDTGAGTRSYRVLRIRLDMHKDATIRRWKNAPRACPQPQTLSPKPSTLSPQVSTLNSEA